MRSGAGSSFPAPVRLASLGLVALLVAGLVPAAAASSAPAATADTNVLAITQSGYVGPHGTLTVSLQVANATGITLVYFTFCQQTRSVCYLPPVTMTDQGNNWFRGTTEPMSNYSGMATGVQAGYNITILYSDNSTYSEPSVPNRFSNLDLGTSVSGEYLFMITVAPAVFNVTGSVVDSATGAAVDGAHVAISPSNASPLTTNATGGFAFGWLANGTYTLSVSAAGYRTQNLSLTVAGANLAKNVPLVNASSTPTAPSSPPTNLISPTTSILLLVVVFVVAAVGTALWMRRHGGGRRGAPPDGPPP